MAFCQPVKPSRCTTGSVEPVNGINKDVSSARLLPTTVSTYPVDWVYFCHLLKTQHYCLCLYGINKDVSGATLLPMTISTYSVDWVCFCHLLKTQHYCLCPNGRYNPHPAVHPPPPPTPPLLPTHPYNMPSMILQLLWKKLLKIQQC